MPMVDSARKENTKRKNQVGLEMCSWNCTKISALWCWGFSRIREFSVLALCMAETRSEL